MVANEKLCRLPPQSPQFASRRDTVLPTEIQKSIVRISMHSSGAQEILHAALIMSRREAISCFAMPDTLFMAIFDIGRLHKCEVETALSNV
jgi:hypothetical protein